MEQIEQTARAFIKENLPKGTSRKLLRAVDGYLRFNKISFASYKKSDLKRDTYSGTIPSFPGIGKTTVDKLKTALQ